MTQLVLEVSNFLTKPLEGFLDLLKTWNAAYRRHKEYKETLNELSRLTDAELQDIGIARGDIRSIARGDEDINPNLRGWV